MLKKSLLVLAVSIGFFGCGEVDSLKEKLQGEIDGPVAAQEEKPIVKKVDFKTEKLDIKSNKALIHVQADLDRDEEAFVYDYEKKLKFESGDATDGYVVLNSGKHMLKLCAFNQHGSFCTEPKSVVISDNVLLSNYYTYRVKSKIYQMTNDGKDLVYIDKNSNKLFSFNIESKTFKQITNNRYGSGGASGLARKDEKTYFFSSDGHINKLDISTGDYEKIVDIAFPDGLTFFKNRLFSVTNDDSGKLSVFDENGRDMGVLQTSIPDICGLAHSDKFLYALGEDGSIYQVDPISGETIKIFTNNNLFDKDEGYNGLEAITVLNNYIYVAYVNDKSIYKINLDISQFEK